MAPFMKLLPVNVYGVQAAVIVTIAYPIPVNIYCMFDRETSSVKIVIMIVSMIWIITPDLLN